MYSVVLMMALSGSAETPELGNRCCGCTGYVSCSCSGFFHRRARCCGCTGAVVTCCGTAPAAAPMPPAGGDTNPPAQDLPPKKPPMDKAQDLPPKKPPVDKDLKPSVPPPPKVGLNAPAPAKIVVTLPADARLTVDGRATTSTSARRVLVTPALQFGGEYVYTLRVEVVRDGQIIAQARTVTVLPGQTHEVPFTMTQDVASR